MPNLDHQGTDQGNGPADTEGDSTEGDAGEAGDGAAAGIGAPDGGVRGDEGGGDDCRDPDRHRVAGEPGSERRRQQRGQEQRAPADEPGAARTESDGEGADVARLIDRDIGHRLRQLDGDDGRRPDRVDGEEAGRRLC